MSVNQLEILGNGSLATCHTRSMNNLLLEELKIHNRILKIIGKRPQDLNHFAIYNDVFWLMRRKKHSCLIM